MGRIMEILKAIKNIYLSMGNEEFKPGDIDTQFRYTCRTCGTTYNTELFNRCPTCEEKY